MLPQPYPGLVVVREDHAGRFEGVLYRGELFWCRRTSTASAFPTVFPLTPGRAFRATMPRCHPSSFRASLI